MLGFRRREARGFAGAFFAVCIANYLLCTILHDHAFFWPALLLYAGCFAAPFALWLYTGALFDDRFTVRPAQALPGLALVAAQYAALFLPREADGALDLLLTLVPRLASLAFILAALARAVRDWSVDLIERRRRFRILFTALVGGYALVVLVIELTLQGRPPPPLVDLAHTLLMGGFAAFSAVRIFTVRADLFPAETAESGDRVAGASFSAAASAAESEAAVETFEDPDLLARLAALMDAQRAWAEEGLTIRSLAEKLLVPEYRLRRVINGALGFRNFNDYLNRFRVAAACRILADPAQHETPVLRIAMDLGYGSLAPFNRAFRALTGMTPTEFRRAPDPARAVAAPSNAKG
jgi:AraC-like DNA-binding protein